MRIQTREHYRNRFADMRDIKRQKEEATRWNRFLKDRTEFDEELANRLDTYEFMMLSFEGRE